MRGFTQDCRQKGIFVWPTECLQQTGAAKRVSLCSAPVPCLPVLSPGISPLTIHSAQGDTPQVRVRLGQLGNIGCHLGVSGERKQTEQGYGCREGNRAEVQGQETLLDKSENSVFCRATGFPPACCSQGHPSLKSKKALSFCSLILIEMAVKPTEGKK